MIIPSTIPLSIPPIKKIFDYFIWGLFGILLILGGIIYVTDRTYPGDRLYSFKLDFENFVLATSSILNKQVDVSIDMVMKRSDEFTKIWSSGYALAGLNRLNTQVDVTANSINQIQDPELKKLEAQRYIAKLDEVSAALSAKQTELAASSTQNNTGTTSQIVYKPAQNVVYQPTGSQNTGQASQPSHNQPSNSSTTTTTTTSSSPTASTTSTSAVSQQINDTQQNIQQKIDQMTNLTTETESNTIPTTAPTEVPTQVPTAVPVIPTSPPPPTTAPTSPPPPTSTPKPQNSDFNGKGNNGWHGFNGFNGNGNN